MGNLPRTSQAPALLKLARVMADAGWEIAFVDLDLTTDRPQAEIKVVRDDGRWLWAKVDSIGRCSVERFQRACWLGMSENTKGRQPLCPQVNDAFLGRESHSDPRAMLRNLTEYLAHNALRPASLPDMQAAWTSLIGAPLQLDSNDGSINS